MGAYNKLCNLVPRALGFMQWQTTTDENTSIFMLSDLRLCQNAYDAYILL